MIERFSSWSREDLIGEIERLETIVDRVRVRLDRGSAAQRRMTDDVRSILAGRSDADLLQDRVVMAAAHERDMVIVES